jgi:hypothetical protein
MTAAQCPVLPDLRWWIGAWRLIGGSGMHRIRRGARIHRNNRSGPSVSAAGVVPVTVVMLRWFVPRDGRAASTRAGVPGAEETSRAIACGVFGVWAGRA